MDARALFGQLREIVVGNDTDPLADETTRKISVIKVLRNETGLGLAEAKGIMDVMMGWKTVPRGALHNETGYKPVAKFPLPDPQVAELQKYAKTVKAELDELDALFETLRINVMDSKTFGEFKKKMEKI